MDIYTKLAQSTSARLTAAYSTSFSLASQLFPPLIRRHIFNIYGLVRLADEIVDTYRGPDQAQLLDDLEAQTYAALKRGYSTNLIVQAFAITAIEVSIDKQLLEPFFASMRRDITQSAYSDTDIDTYIYGSAEVVGLMCLKVFTADTQQYEQLKPGAQALGSAFQKVNFLRDMSLDHAQLGRMYFPGITYASFNDESKRQIEADIIKDFDKALLAIRQLPANARPAVLASYRYYRALLRRIQRLSASELKSGRVRLPNALKLAILSQTAISSRLRNTLRFAKS
jgi:phytoene synthase